MFNKVKSLIMENTLVKKLENGVTKFTYIKKSGETRKAVGTLNVDTIVQATGLERALVESQVAKATGNRYFDLEKLEWRIYYSLLEVE